MTRAVLDGVVECVVDGVHVGIGEGAGAPVADQVGVGVIDGVWVEVGEAPCPANPLGLHVTLGECRAVAVVDGEGTTWDSVLDQEVDRVGRGVAVGSGVEVRLVDGEGLGVAEGLGVHVMEGVGLGVRDGVQLPVADGVLVPEMEAEWVALYEAVAVAVLVQLAAPVTEGLGLGVGVGERVAVRDGEGLGVPLEDGVKVGNVVDVRVGIGVSDTEWVGTMLVFVPVAVAVGRAVLGNEAVEVQVPGRDSVPLAVWVGMASGVGERVGVVLQDAISTALWPCTSISCLFQPSPTGCFGPFSSQMPPQSQIRRCKTMTGRVGGGGFAFHAKYRNLNQCDAVDASDKVGPQA
jgi:hypothetical protein